MSDGDRLSLRKEILDLIDERRSAENDEGIGGAIERRIISEEMASIEGPVVE